MSGWGCDHGLFPDLNELPVITPDVKMPTIVVILS